MLKVKTARVHRLITHEIAGGRIYRISLQNKRPLLYFFQGAQWQGPMSLYTRLSVSVIGIRSVSALENEVSAKQERNACLKKKKDLSEKQAT
jgi:hypothetical protein